MRSPPHSREQLHALVVGYVVSVVDGTRVVGRFERLAVERHLRDLERAAADGATVRFTPERAFQVLEFAEACIVHYKGEWARRPFRFCELSAWEAFIFWVLFGWERFDPEEQAWRRRFVQALICVARKNGKTMLAAIIALFMLAFDGEVGAEVYFAATKRDQARIGWKAAAKAIQRSTDPEFRALFEVREPVSRIVCHELDAVCQALGRDQDTQDGPDPYCAIVDELHAHRDRGMWDVLMSGQGSRAEPLQLGVTTEGYQSEGLLPDLLKDAQRVLDEIVDDDSTFYFVAQLDEKDDPFDESVWPKANPNLGVSVKKRYLRDRANQAKNNPANLSEFVTKNCNRRAASQTKWLPLGRWEECARDISIDNLRGEPCWEGVDLSKTSDFTALVRVFPRPGGEYWVFPKFWIPEETLDQRVKDGQRYVLDWVRDGYIVATPGEIIDQDFVKQQILDDWDRYDLREIPFDQAQAWKLMGELQQLLGEKRVTSFPQSWTSMHGAFKEATDLALTRKLVHDGNPVLRWMVDNVAVRKNATGLQRPDKGRSVDRIDGVTALVMALGRALAGNGGDVSMFVIGSEGSA